MSHLERNPAEEKRILDEARRLGPPPGPRDEPENPTDAAIRARAAELSQPVKVLPVYRQQLIAIGLGDAAIARLEAEIFDLEGRGLSDGQRGAWCVARAIERRTEELRSELERGDHASLRDAALQIAGECPIAPGGERAQRHLQGVLIGLHGRVVETIMAELRTRDALGEARERAAKSGASIDRAELMEQMAELMLAGERVTQARKALEERVRFFTSPKITEQLAELERVLGDLRTEDEVRAEARELLAPVWPLFGQILAHYHEAQAVRAERWKTACEVRNLAAQFGFRDLPPDYWGGEGDRLVASMLALGIQSHVSGEPALAEFLSRSSHRSPTLTRTIDSSPEMFTPGAPFP